MSEDTLHEKTLNEVTIGDRTWTIPRFRGLKATLAGALISRVMREIPELQERTTQFRRDFREKNTIMITPAMAKLPRFEGLGLTEEDFRVSGGKVEFPEEPEAGAILVNVFPDLFDLAKAELQKFLALIVIPNSQLFEADDADKIDEELDRLGKSLLREGDIDELLELVIVGLEVLREQMSRKRDRLGKLQVPILQALLGPPPGMEETPEEKEPENPEPGETPTVVEEVTSPESSSEPGSSTLSQPDSDGIDERSSEMSPGMS